MSFAPAPNKERVLSHKTRMIKKKEENSARKISKFRTRARAKLRMHPARAQYVHTHTRARGAAVKRARQRRDACAELRISARSPANKKGKSSVPESGIYRPERTAIRRSSVLSIRTGQHGIFIQISGAIGDIALRPEGPRRVPGILFAPRLCARAHRESLNHDGVRALAAIYMR